VIIEKHITLDRRGDGLDDSFFLEPEQFAALCRDAHTAWSARGTVDDERKSSEEKNIIFRRSLYFVKDLTVGEIITADAIRSVRPGNGAAPKLLDYFIGKKTRRSIAANTPARLDDIA
jgi:N-acetylneuraminate synthase